MSNKLIEWDRMPPESIVAMDTQLAELTILWTSGPPWIVVCIDPRLGTRAWGHVRRFWWTGVVWARRSERFETFPWTCPDCEANGHGMWPLVSLVLSLRCPRCPYVEPESSWRDLE